MSWNGAFNRTFKETVSNPNAQNGDVLVYDSAYDRWLPSSQAYQDNGTAPSIRHLSTGTILSGVQSLDVETITTNGATLSLTQDSYFSPNITVPTVLSPGVYGLFMTYPTGSSQWDRGHIVCSAIDSSGNTYIALDANTAGSTQTNYIQSLNGSTSLQVAINSNTSNYSDTYIAKFDAAGALQWAWKPFVTRSGTNNYITCVGAEVLTNGNIQYIFYVKYGNIDALNQDGSVRTAGFITDMQYGYVQLTVNNLGAIVSENKIVSTTMTVSNQNNWFAETCLWNGNVLIPITTAGQYTTSPNQLYGSNTGTYGYNVALVYLNGSSVSMMANPIQLNAASEGLLIGGLTTDSSGNLFVSLLYNGSGGTYTINNLSTNSSSGHTVYLSSPYTNVVLWYNSAGAFVQTCLVIPLNNLSMMDIECDDKGNIYGYWSTSQTSVSVGGKTASSNFAPYPSGWVIKFTPTGTVSQLTSCIDAYGLSYTWYSFNRRLMFDSTNKLMYLCMPWNGSVVSGVSLFDLGATTAGSVVSQDRLSYGGTSVFVLDTSTDKWYASFTPVSIPSTGHINTQFLTFRVAQGKLIINGYISTDQSTVQINNADKTSTVSLSTDPNGYSTSTFQPFLLTYAFNGTPMAATLPLPTPSTNNYLQKTLIMQPGFSYVITEENNAGNNTRTIPTASSGLTVVTYYYVNDRWTPDYSTVDLINTVVYNSSTQTTTTSTTDAATLNGFNASQFVRSDTASGITCASSTRAFTVNNQSAGNQVASFQSSGSEILGVNAGGCAITGSLSVSGNITGIVSWTNLINVPQYIVYCQNITSDVQSQLNSLSTRISSGSYLPLSGGELTGELVCNTDLIVRSFATVYGNLDVSGNITGSGNLIISGNMDVSGIGCHQPVSFYANNPSMLEKSYGPGDTYGLSQDSGGQLNLYMSGTYTPAAINIGKKDSSGNMTTHLHINNSGQIIANTMQVINGPLQVININVNANSYSFTATQYLEIGANYMFTASAELTTVQGNYFYSRGCGYIYMYVNNNGNAVVDQVSGDGFVAVEYGSTITFQNTNSSYTANSLKISIMRLC